MIDSEVEAKAGAAREVCPGPQSGGNSGSPVPGKSPPGFSGGRLINPFISGSGYDAFLYGHIVDFAFSHAVHAFVVVES